MKACDDPRLFQHTTPHHTTHHQSTDLLTHSVRVVRTSESMALAKTTDPSAPKRGMRRVLLLPGMGHLATTTILPRATILKYGGRGLLSLDPLVLEEVLLVVVAVTVDAADAMVMTRNEKVEDQNCQATRFEAQRTDYECCEYLLALFSVTNELCDQRYPEFDPVGRENLLL
jgi:hypothetical protein